jgi:hypothetical protein
MRKVAAGIFACVTCLSILFVAGSSAQVVPETKQTSKKVYRTGHRKTVTTWRHGKKITKRVWVKGNRKGRKVVHKTKDVMMGPEKKTP